MYQLKCTNKGKIKVYRDNVIILSNTVLSEQPKNTYFSIGDI